ncbi:MAG TPA: PilZ domain-containing protein [Candidatus Acidoferrum sp.]|nr:PilZ domain-containing protein [Candidatus Acidoferrum sp.]
MDQNRRRFLRKVPDDIAFIQIERDEVGKLLNISEGGLSFSSITPVPRNLPVYFWFSFNLKDRIEAMGEVTWTDISRTIGGLKFTQLSQTNREVIQKWVSRLRREEPPEEIEAVEEEIQEPEEESLVPQLVAVGEPEPFRPRRPAAPVAAPVKSNGLDRVARFVSKARAYKPVSPFAGKVVQEPKHVPAAPLRATSALETAVLGTTALAIEPPKLLPERPLFSMEAGPAPSAPSTPSAGAKSSSFDAKSSSFSSSFSFRGIESLIELVPLQRHLSAKKRQLVCGVLLGIGISALVTLPALKFWNSRAHAETLKPALANSSTLSAATQPPASDPATVTPKPAYPVAGVFSDPNPLPVPTKGTTSSFAFRTHLPASYWKEARGEPAKTTPVKSQKSLAGTSASSIAPATTNIKSGMNPTQLWTEVQAGNSKAAVELAELYIKGSGVPRNCQQARVLLLVASEKRNTAAIKRLHDLDKGAACP